eukprot:260162-Ditylum_brightwellii.AAC.1
MGQRIESEAMLIYARKSHAKLSTNLMEFIVPTSNTSLKSNIKFIPAHMQFDKSLPNAAQKYADLLREQNLYLKQYDNCKIGGLHSAALDHELDNGNTLQSLMLEEPSIVDINSTVFTQQKGIWTIKTTKTDIT